MSKSDSGVVIKDMNLCIGHNIVYNIPVRTLAAMRSEPFIIDYNINCTSFPTSWRFEVIYDHNVDTGIVSCFVTLRRTDASEGYVVMFSSLAYIESNGRFVCYPKSIFNGDIPPGAKLEGSIVDSRHPGYRSYIVSLGLYLKISLFVRNCHSTQNYSSSISGMHLSKL